VSCRRRKSTRSNVSPKHSPWRSLGTGCKDHERPIAVGDRRDDRLHDLGLQRLDPSRFSLRQPGPGSGVLRDDPVSDRGPEDGDHVPVDELDCSRLENFREAADPSLDLGRADGADRSITERRVDVTAQVRLYLDRRRRPVNLDRPPLLAVGLECDSAGTWVGVGARQLRVVGGGEVLLRVDFPRECLRTGLPIGGTLAGPPAGRHLGDGAHNSSFVGKASPLRAR
jgi:hypothetical protein